LDPGYAAAAKRRGGRPSRQWYDRPAVAVGCALIGLTLVVAYLQTHRAAPAAAKVHSSLVSRVRTAEHQDTTLNAQLEHLNASVNAIRDRALPASGALIDALNADQLAAGQVAVQGPGLKVTLKDPHVAPSSGAPARNGSVPIAATNTLTDRDVQSVVNELWADGAEAIAVNGVRLSPTSAIRFAGQAILVDFEPITSPYTIEAVGDRDQLDTSFAGSEVASRYQTLISADGIGFAFSEEKTVRLAATSPVVLRYAHVPSAGASTAGGGR
jgi:uncharacterized protein YlxW (UPF0749 family)